MRRNFVDPPNHSNITENAFCCIFEKKTCLAKHLLQKMDNQKGRGRSYSCADKKKIKQDFQIDTRTGHGTV
jgi:hypothetical protein